MLRGCLKVLQSRRAKGCLIQCFKIINYVKRVIIWLRKIGSRLIQRVVIEVLTDSRYWSQGCISNNFSLHDWVLKVKCLMTLCLRSSKSTTVIALCIGNVCSEMWNFYQMNVVSLLRGSFIYFYPKNPKPPNTHVAHIASESFKTSFKAVITFSLWIVETLDHMVKTCQLWPIKLIYRIKVKLIKNPGFIDFSYFFCSGEWSKCFIDEKGYLNTF